jgi:hypothetical protein
MSSDFGIPLAQGKSSFINPRGGLIEEDCSRNNIHSTSFDCGNLSQSKTVEY